MYVYILYDRMRIVFVLYGSHCQYSLMEKFRTWNLPLDHENYIFDKDF